MKKAKQKTRLTKRTKADSSSHENKRVRKEFAKSKKLDRNLYIVWPFSLVAICAVMVIAGLIYQVGAATSNTLYADTKNSWAAKAYKYDVNDIDGSSSGNSMNVVKDESTVKSDGKTFSKLRLSIGEYKISPDEVRQGLPIEVNGGGLVISSLNDWRGLGFHFGTDFAINDTKSINNIRSSPVFAKESMTVKSVTNNPALDCTNKKISAGKYSFWHIEPSPAMKKGKKINKGDLIGWTCNREWHIHVSVRSASGLVWINPKYAFSAADNISPVVDNIGFFEYSPTKNNSSYLNNLKDAPQGSKIDLNNVQGRVDIRADINDKMTIAYTNVSNNRHPDLIRTAIIPLSGSMAGKEIFRQDIHNDALFNSFFWPRHYAPGTTNDAIWLTTHHEMIDDNNKQVPLAKGSSTKLNFRFHIANAGASLEPFWDSRSVPNGKYRLIVTSCDQKAVTATTRTYKNCTEKAVNFSVNN